MTQTQTAEIISVAQLPIIIEKLHEIKAAIESDTSAALALECTEETVKAVKKSRTALTNSFGDYENRRKEVKAQILAPYEAFDKIYKECITEPFKTADTQLAKKIGDVETGLKNAKQREVIAYFEEYRTSVGLAEEDAPFSKAQLNITLTATAKSLKEQAKAYVDRIQQDLAAIATLDSHEEIIIEYKNSGNLAAAVATVKARHEAIEAERRRREDFAKRRAEQEARAAAVEKVVEANTFVPAITPPVEEFAAPVVTPPVKPVEELPKEPIYEVSFTVRATREQLRALKEFMTKEGFDFE